MQKAFYIVILSFLFSCQNRNSYDQEFSGEDTVTLYTVTDTVYKYDAQKVLANYVMQLKDSLVINKLPEFIYDECLDVNSMGYCRINSHRTRSLRSDIIDQLDKYQIQKILLLSNEKKLKKICHSEFMEELHNGKRCNYDLLYKAQAEQR